MLWSELKNIIEIKKKIAETLKKAVSWSCVYDLRFWVLLRSFLVYLYYSSVFYICCFQACYYVVKLAFPVLCLVSCVIVVSLWSQFCRYFNCLPLLSCVCVIHDVVLWMSSLVSLSLCLFVSLVLGSLAFARVSSSLALSAFQLCLPCLCFCLPWSSCVS